MKTIIYTLLLLCLFACKLPTQTNEAIFKYDNGEIVTKPEYINPFYFEYQDVKSYPVESFTIFSKNNEHSYSVKLSNYQGTEGDGGYYRSIDVEYKNKNILSLKQSDGWDKLQNTSDHWLPMTIFSPSLTDSSTALVFVGYPYNSQPELADHCHSKQRRSHVGFQQRNHDSQHKIRQSKPLLCHEPARLSR